MLQIMLAATLALVAAQAAAQGPSRTGWEAIQAGDGARAAAAFREAIAANPRDPDALVGAALAAHLLGRDDQAISSLKRAMEIAPNDAHAAYVLGPIAYAAGDINLAITAYERVVRIAPGNADVYQQLEAWKKEAALHESFESRPGVRFNVLFEGPAQQPIADRVSATLEAAYLRVGKALNAYPAETITAILYTKEQFHDITKSPTWAAAAYDGRIRIPVRGAMRVPGEVERIVTHEFVHALIHSLGTRVPRWLNEGLATHFEPGDHRWLQQRLRAAPAIIPMARLEAGFGQFDGDEAALAYAESMVGAQVLVERLGPSFPVFLEYVGNGTSVEQALLVFNISAADLEREWIRRARPASR